MAIGITILGITGIGIIWILYILKKESNNRKQEQSIVDFLSTEIKKLRNDFDNLKK